MRTLHEEMKKGLDIREDRCWVHSNPGSLPFFIMLQPNAAPLGEVGDCKLNVSQSISSGPLPKASKRAPGPEETSAGTFSLKWKVLPNSDASIFTLTRLSATIFSVDAG